MRHFATFWWLVLQRAFFGSGTFSNNWQTLGAFIAGLLLLWLKVEVRAISAFGGLLLPFAFAGMAWFIFFLARLMIWAPYKVFADQKTLLETVGRKNQEIELRLKPRITLNFSKELHGCVYRTPVDLNSHLVMADYFRIKVSCLSETGVNECRGRLRSVAGPAGVYDIQALDLLFASAEPAGSFVIDMHPGVSEYLAICKATCDNRLGLIYPPPYSFPDGFFTQCGDYTFDISVVAKGIAAVTINVVLRWNGGWDQIDCFTVDQDVHDLLDACKLAIAAMGPMDAARHIQGVIDAVEARRGLTEASVVRWPGKNRR